MATISNATGTMGLAASVAVGSTTITATSGSVSGTASLAITPASLVSIGLAPLNPTIALGLSQQFTATGTYTDQTTKDITTNVTWTSSSATVAVISNTTGSQGLAASSGAGSTTITAVIGSISAKTLLTVGSPNLLSIAVTPQNPSLTVGASLQMTATGTFTNGTKNVTTSSTWSSSDVTVATVGSSGLAHALKAGSAILTGTDGTASNSPMLTVTPATLQSVAVTPVTASVLVGGTQQFTATGTYSDGTTNNVTASVNWIPSNTAVATVTPAGLATGVSARAATITATSGSYTGQATLTVSVPAPVLTSITVTPTIGIIRFGAALQFKATGAYSNGSKQDLTLSASWTSSNTAFVTITASGLATGVGAGSSKITAALGSVSGQAVPTVYGAFAPTGSKSIERSSQTATLLNSGMVLITGGVGITGSPLASVEIYNPATDTFSSTGAMSAARNSQTATLLNNGKVLVTGGYGSNPFGPLGSAELYDPAAGTFSATGSMG